MHRRLSYAALIPALIAATSLIAQEEEKGRDLPIATIDVAYIFKNYQPAAERVAELRTAAQEVENTLKVRQVEIDQLQRKLMGPPRDGDDRQKIQQQLIKLQAELQVYITNEKRALQRRELEIQADVYKQIQAEVQKIAKERKLKLVLVRPRGSLESQDLAEVNRTINQLVIFEEGLDISDDVLKALERNDK